MQQEFGWRRRWKAPVVGCQERRARSDAPDHPGVGGDALGDCGVRFQSVKREIAKKAFVKSRDRQRVGKATSGEICIHWLQARRARSDAPDRAGRAAGPFDFIAHFGIRVNSILPKDRHRARCIRDACKTAHRCAHTIPPLAGPGNSARRTAGWEACATRVCHGFAGFTMKYPG